MFTRECPVCGKELIYQHKTSWQRAIRQGSRCPSCVPSPNKGKKLSAAHRAKLSKSLCKYFGVDEPRNKNQAAEKRWQRAVKKRDKHCQHCGATDNLHAHHIFPRHSHPEQQYNVHNGITLCQTCHFDLHSIINPFRPHDKFNTPYSNEDAA